MSKEPGLAFWTNSLRNHLPVASDSEQPEVPETTKIIVFPKSAQPGSN